MNKRIITTAITSIGDITSLKRAIDGSTKGIEINSIFTELTNYWDEVDLPSDYNEAGSYITGRKVDLLPESTTSNTLITNDGLIAVFIAPTTLVIADMFEPSTETYTDIESNGYETLAGYTDSINPLNRRLFIGSIESGLVKVSNDKVYADNQYTYFVSQMNYDLEVDDNYNYKVLNTNWLSYLSTSDFIFYKKQFFYIKLIVDGEDINADDITISNPNIVNIEGTNFFRVIDVAMTSSKIEFTIGITGYNGKKCYLEVI
jgi:hypothetical protein